jgi:hypothetical protein
MTNPRQIALHSGFDGNSLYRQSSQSFPSKQIRNPLASYHFQLNLFSQNNGIHEYSAVTTDTRTWKHRGLLLFSTGRSGRENSISEQKDDFAFDYAPSQCSQGKLDLHASE